MLKSSFDKLAIELQLENETKKIHFMEIGWLVYFPRSGNKGKYRNYSVIFRDRRKGRSQPGKCIKLGEVLDNPEFEQHYPHTIGYYKESSGEGANFKPEYLEIRKIRTVEEFWMFLNALDI
jgi:hypothetical protein